jgi:hypothetical protein
VYASDMRVNYGARTPISDANPTGSRVSSTGLVLSWDGHTLRNGKAKNFADGTGVTDGTLSGGVTAGGATGIRGAATALDGVDDQIQGAGLPAVGSGTVWAIFSRTRTGVNEGIIELYGASPVLNASPWIRLDTSGRIAATFPGATGMLNTAANTLNYDCPVGIHFVEFKWTATGYSFALDGVVLERVISGCTFPATGTNYAIGRYYDTRVLGGNVIEALVWGRYLSDSESRQQYEDTFGWVRNTANPHCFDIDDQHPLGTDRVVMGDGQSLLAAYDMETLTAAGLLYDASGGGHHATVTGAKYQRGMIKNATMAFAAAGDNINTGITADYAQLTYIFVIRPTNFTAAYNVLGKLSGDQITLEQTTGKLIFGSNGTVKATNGLTAGQGAIVIVKVDGNNVSFKLNNVANGSGAVTGRTASANPYKIGSFGGTALIGMIGPTFIINGITTDAQDTNLFYDSQKMLGLVQGGTSDINVPGQVGAAVDLNGTSQYIEVQDCPAIHLTSMSLGAWVNSDATNPWKNILSRWGGTIASAAYGLRLNASGRPQIDVSDGSNSSNVAAGSALVQNKWVLLVGTFEGVNGRLYVNAVAETPITNAIVPQATSNPLRIGEISTTTGFAFDGLIAWPFVASQAYSQQIINRILLAGRMARW